MMPDPNDFEGRLADVFRRYAGRVPTDVDATALAREIATASAHGTDRHRRWWPFGQTHTIMRRTQTMFSPAKAIMAGALVFAIGGVVLIAQPFDQRGGGVPGAATDDPAMAPGFFSGTVGDDPTWRVNASPVAERREDGVVESTGESYTFPWDANDPRISGRATTITSETDYREGATMLAPTGDIGTVRTGLIRIVNDAGSWEGPYTDLQIDNLDLESSAGWLTGTDAYEGLFAYFVWDFVDGVFHGHITAEGPPPAPESLTE